MPHCVPRRAFAAGLLCVAIASGSALAAKSDLHVTGSFAGEHGTTSTPSGTVDGTYDVKTHVLTYKIDWSGLTGPVVAAHFHGPAKPGVDAGVLQPITPPYDSPISGTWTLSGAQAKALRAGRVYVNLHTKAFPAGEARANLTAD